MPRGWVRASTGDQMTPAASVGIVPMTADRLDSAGQVFASSHADYPPWRYVFPDARQRERAQRVFFEATVRDALQFGAVDAAVAGGRVLGSAVWLPPGRFPWSLARKLRVIPTMLRVLSVAPRRFRLFAGMGANAERFHPAYPHWNLETLGIRREAQGGGIGSRLMAPGLARADDAGLPCYLTTAKEPNLAFYERFGFEVTEKALPLVPGGPTHWGMRRLPRTTR
jgi:ribosomal protein S18 acetylase RimI-like enzyme